MAQINDKMNPKRTNVHGEAHPQFRNPAAKNKNQYLNNNDQICQPDNQPVLDAHGNAIKNTKRPDN